MTRCGTRRKKRELRNIVRSSRFFLQPCCRSGWPRPTSGASCCSGARCPVPCAAPMHDAIRHRFALPLRYRAPALFASRSVRRPALLRSIPGAGAPSPACRCSFEVLCYSPASGTSPLHSRGGRSLSGLPASFGPPRRYRPAANSLSRAISSGQRSSSGVSRMSGMPSKRASEAM